ncbi:DUF262 domain-containing protein [Candidatus Micrarchaeota archaeon]|nr:DUF262 domain-containing protein [Candidatus Micrarchaeota archaeon]MBU1166487.1 DUF262 domain-containing protein [Candidatus Micrarchaeota archaeon]MBU1887145.1 DUF262 domain-containing protein [Candidatus Micrarchaeota archaeon]
MFEGDERNPKVEELVKYASEQRIFLPEFQRDFVWNRTQIKLLIDSLYQEYTINSILTWEGTDELARRRIGGSFEEIIFPDGDTNKRITYLLDGQQRLTALMLVFSTARVYKGKNKRKYEKIDLFFDSSYQGDDPELRFVYSDDELLDLNDDNEKIKLDDFTDEECFKRFGTRFINLKDIYDEKRRNNIEELIGTSSGNDKEKMNMLSSYLKTTADLKSRLLSVPINNIVQKGDLDSILDIFERINTLNTKLNIYDIMIAKTYKKLGSDYFDLRNFLKMINYKGAIKDDYLENKKNDQIFSMDENDFPIDGETLLFLILIILDKKFKQKLIKKITTEKLIENMKNLHKTYWKIVNYIKTTFYVEPEDLSDYVPMIKFLTAYISETPNITPTEQKFLNRWFWNTLLYNRYPGSQNERIERDYKTVKELGMDKAIEKYKKERVRNFNSNSNQDQTIFDAYNSDTSTAQLYWALTLLLINNGAMDFYSGILVTPNASQNISLEHHHIFPRGSKTGKRIVEYDTETEGSVKDGLEYEDIINNFANIALITKETNNNKISNADPSEYILSFEKEYEEAGKLQRFKEIMMSQFIDDECLKYLKENNFNAFIKTRTRLIKQKINELCD